jgi:hypothetical protein
MSYYRQESMPYYIGAKYQEGHGLGSVLSSIGKVAIPWIKHGVKYLGEEVVDKGCGIAKDVLAGRRASEAFNERLFGQRGSGYKRKRSSSKRISRKKSSKRKVAPKKKSGTKKRKVTKKVAKKDYLN